MSDEQNPWNHPPNSPFADDEQTPVPAPTVPATFGNTGSFARPAAPGHAGVPNPPTGQMSPPSGQYGVGQTPFPNQASGSFATGQFGNPVTGQHQAIGQPGFGNPPTGQFGVPPAANAFGNPPTGQFSTGQFGQPSAFGNPATGQFPTQPIGNPATGQFATNQFANPASGQFSTEMPGEPLHRAPSDQMPVQPYHDATGSFAQPYVTGQMPGVGLVAPIATPPPMKAVQVVTPRMRAIYGAGGAFFGLVAGVFLGILNSALEGVGFGAGIGVTIQISCGLGSCLGSPAARSPSALRTCCGPTASLTDEFGVHAPCKGAVLGPFFWRPHVTNVTIVHA
ncbi:MAG: hypothetical protein R3E66_10135 [bacterium]